MEPDLHITIKEYHILGKNIPWNTMQVVKINKIK